MPDWLTPLVVQGGAVSILAAFSWRLISSLIGQITANADRWQRAAEAADKRADESVRLLGEVLSALRAVEALVRNPRDKI